MNKRARITSADAQATFTSLRSLMAAVEPAEVGEGAPAIEVELGRLRPNPDQPRHASSPAFSRASLEELAENIRQHGLLNPILVKSAGRFYQIVAGERRYRACQMLGLERVPVRIVEPRDEQDELMIALAENLQRKNLGALEEALSFRTLIQRYGLSYRELSRLSGRSVAHVHGRLQLLEHDDVREAVEQKRVGIADAIQLARVPDEAQRKELLASVQDGSLRGAALHRQVQVFLGELGPEASTAEPALPAEPTLQAAAAAVQRLSDEPTEEELETLRMIVSRGAELLGLEVRPSSQREEAVTPTPPLVPALEPEPEGPTALTPELRRVISRTKEYRTHRGYTLANLIRLYWMSMARRGYSFSPGEWGAAPRAGGKTLVWFGYALDGEHRRIELEHDAEGLVRPLNDEARALVE